ncbi:uncharacterized protein LOC115891015 isoform X2 [Sitophilus oryzae]|uniref:Uncharacterized protein LOC115891015 isoform X2 n=1 Tax=Sitophilus oryzae TaxID=7048 RepID=A0A6J2YWN4_SITOR|nr:uncharacterized protein LOC115891015 isoform X2 [Sitophilus oryzae]
MSRRKLSSTGEFQWSRRKLSSTGELKLATIPKIDVAGRHPSTSSSIFSTETLDPSEINLGALRGDSLTQQRMSFLPSSLRMMSRSSTAGTFRNMGIDGASPWKSGERTVDYLFENYCTGSSYLGEYNKLGICGKGMYKFPHGVIYDGRFNKKGEFHGSGTLTYPSGQKVEGFWRNGKLQKNPTNVSADNTPYRSQYCRMPDRRFQIEVTHDLAPAPKEFLTNAPNPPRKIPPGSYDTGEGFYDPVKKVMLDYDDLKVSVPMYESESVYEGRESMMLTKTLSKPISEFNIVPSSEDNDEKRKKLRPLPIAFTLHWVINNCRTAWDTPVGYNPKLYEAWSTGTKSDDFLPIHESNLESEHSSETETVIAKLLAVADATDTASGMYSFIERNRYSRDDVTTSLIALKDMFRSQDFKHLVVKKAIVYQILRSRNKNKKLKKYREKKISFQSV